MEVDKLVPEGQLAAELGKHARTLLRWRQRGVGPDHVKLGGRYYYTREAIQRWLEACKQEAKT